MKVDKNAKSTKCQVDQLSSWPIVKLTKYQVDQMSSWPNVKLTKCQVDQMSSWPNGKLTKWQVDQMSSWHNVELKKEHTDMMTRWQHEKLIKWQLAKCQCDEMIKHPLQGQRVCRVWLQAHQSWLFTSNIVNKLTSGWLFTWGQSFDNGIFNGMFWCDMKWYLMPMIQYQTCKVLSNHF